MRTIHKILVANRGEIAIRVMRTARAMGIPTVAVYSDADKNALFVSYADEAVALGGNAAAESYLVQDKIIEAAKRTGANAIHPGYGFLSENASFSDRCKKEGIIFIGPSAEAIIAMGSKIGAKELMKKAGVPVVPGYNEADQSDERLQKEATSIGFPILIKASAGGGGKGMRIVNNAAELIPAVDGARREAEKSFGDSTLLLEKYFPSAKHIEFQIFGDEHGNALHLFERECSLQRRYQKVIEESPSPSLTPELRAKMGEAAVAAAKSIGYTNAGTVEFLLDKSGNFYFLEVNTRLQVEHPVTELTTGLDLVQLQIEVAQGLPLKIQAANLVQRGHAIECRLCAEDPENNFFPSTGEILYYNEPALEGLRYDSGVKTGSVVDIHYDSMIAKVISYADNREGAIRRMLYALDRMSVLGVTNNKDFLKELLLHKEFVDGSFDTKLIERDYFNWQKNATAEQLAAMAIAITLFNWNKRKASEVYSHSLNGWRNIHNQNQQESISINGINLASSYVYKGNNAFLFTVTAEGAEPVHYEVTLNTACAAELTVTINSHRQTFVAAANANECFIQHPTAGSYKAVVAPRFAEPGSVITKGSYIAPMPGEVVKVLIKPGDAVKSGQGLLVMSSMKMESTIEAYEDGEVEEVFVGEKSFVEANSLLLKMKN
ncbi:MAG: acetyl-CoA carboxylase biotin carboxylase subunit [Chitinophagales bacterium]